MFQVLVACASCEEETEVVAEALDDVEREICPCGYSYVVERAASSLAGLRG